jgi:hypothetical protein
MALQSDPESYLTGTTGVFPFAIGRSYFEPILPPGRVHLGWNSWTLQWLSRHPRPVPDHLNSAMSVDPIARAEAARQAADDWGAFLKARSSELRPGGKFVSLMVGRTEMTHWRHSVLSELWAAALDLAAAGRLNGNELLRINLPTYARSFAELTAPFQGTGRFAGLSIEHAAILDGPDPVWDQFQELRDAERLGRARANAYRAIFGPTILAALDPERDREATVDALFTRHAERLATSPQRHENYLAVVVLAKDSVGAG